MPAGIAGLGGAVDSSAKWTANLPPTVPKDPRKSKPTSPKPDETFVNIPLEKVIKVITVPLNPSKQQQAWLNQIDLAKGQGEQYLHLRNGLAVLAGVGFAGGIMGYAGFITGVATSQTPTAIATTALVTLGGILTGVGSTLASVYCHNRAKFCLHDQLRRGGQLGQQENPSVVESGSPPKSASATTMAYRSSSMHHRELQV